MVNFNALVPELSVADIKKTKAFYLDILGFTLEYERVQDGFAFLSYGEAQMMLEQKNGSWETGELAYPFGRGINFQIQTNELEALHRRLVANGCALFREPYDAGYGENGVAHNERELLVQDPDGYLLRFSQTLEE